MQYVGDNTDNFIQAGEGIRDLLARLKEHPEVGYPLFGNYINTITNGARLGKLYIRSASTGTGKTRSMIADACTLSCKNYIIKRQDNGKIIQ